MFLVEGGMSFDTRNAVAGARAFQREIIKTGKVAQTASTTAKDTEEAFSNIGGAKTRAALRGLQTSLMGAKDGTDAAIAGAKALQVALVKSVAGTAIVSGASILADGIRDVGAGVKAAATEIDKIQSSFNGFATSLEDGRARADKMTIASDNLAKTIASYKDGGLFKSIAFAITGAQKELEALEKTAQRISQSEFQMGAAAERATTERRAGMTPEEIEADKRKAEEQKRLAEARAKGGPKAEADVAATIAIENQVRQKEKLIELDKSAKKFEEDLAKSAAKVADMNKAAEEEKKKARMNSLVPAARIVEIDKESVSVSQQIAEIQKTGIFGTEEKRKAQLEEIEKLNGRLLSLEKQKADAIKEQADEERNVAEAKKQEASKAIDVEIEERKRQRESRRSRQEAMAEVRRNQEAQQRERMDEELSKFFGADAWKQVPEYLRQQILNGGVTNRQLSDISRNTYRSAGGGGMRPEAQVQPSGRIGRPKSGPGMERPPGYIPEALGVNQNFGSGYRGGFGGFLRRSASQSTMEMMGTPSTVSPDNPYKRTRMPGQGGGGAGGDLAAAIKELASKIPAAVPV